VPSIFACCLPADIARRRCLSCMRL
jgi:hypothetical protein